MMINQRNSQNLLATLTLCLCLGSLVLMPFAEADPFVSEVYGFIAEDYNLLDHIELDDDFIFGSTIGVLIAGLFVSLCRLKSMGFQSTYSSPVSPPPKLS
jgi:hypothetical protein